MAKRVYKYFMILMIMSVLLGISLLMDSVIEAVIMSICFLSSKRKYRFKYHSKSSFSCFLLSVTVFPIAFRVTLPVGVSYVFSGICGLLIAYISQYIAELRFIQEDYDYIEPRYNQYVEANKAERVYAMSEVELRQHCKSKHLDDIDEEITVQRLIYMMKGNSLYSRIGYSKAQMIRREKKIEQILGIKLKDR